jgi:hypothetical protein
MRGGGMQYSGAKLRRLCRNRQSGLSGRPSMSLRAPDGSRFGFVWSNGPTGRTPQGRRADADKPFRNGSAMSGTPIWALRPAHSGTCTGPRRARRRSRATTGRGNRECFRLQQPTHMSTIGGFRRARAGRGPLLPISLREEHSGGEGGIRTRGRLLTYARLASGYLRPLGHLSVSLVSRGPKPSTRIRSSRWRFR